MCDTEAIISRGTGVYFMPRAELDQKFVHPASKKILKTRIKHEHTENRRTHVPCVPWRAAGGKRRGCELGGDSVQGTKNDAVVD